MEEEKVILNDSIVKSMGIGKVFKKDFVTQ